MGTGSTDTGKNLLVIGFDGLDYELFKNYVRPPFDLLPLYAPVPVTGPSWTSLYTGDSVTTHNVRDVFGLEFRRRYARNDTLHLIRWHLHNLGRLLRGKATHKRFATYATTPSKYLWDTLNAGGVDVKLVNMPITCPVREIKGLHVGGFPLVRRGRWYWPDEIAHQIPDDYIDLVDITHWFQDPERDSHRVWRRAITATGFEANRQRVVDTANRLVDLFCELPPARLQMVQFSFIDRLGHVFGVRDEVERFGYELAGSLVGRLVAGVKPDATMIISDHGFMGDEHTDKGCLAVDATLRPMLQVAEGYTPSVLDIAPTIAAYFGLAHPCEGNDLTAGGNYTTRHDEQDEQEKAEITKRLRALGYM